MYPQLGIQLSQSMQLFLIVGISTLASAMLNSEGVKARPCLRRSHLL
jgi:hypothetical protein